MPVKSRVDKLLNRTITLFSPLFYFDWNSGLLWIDTLYDYAGLRWWRMLRGRRFVHLPVSFGCFEPLNGDNVEKFNSRRIEYFRTKSRPDSFMANEFFRVSSVRCAVHFADDRLHCREVPEPPVMTTVFMAMKSLLRAMKTVVGEKRTVKGKKFRFFVGETKTG